MTVVLFIAVLAFLIFIHELGHFLFAKLSDAQVDEFCIGFPPRIFSKKYGETLYSIGILPIGGFVKIVGEDGDYDTNPPRMTAKNTDIDEENNKLQPTTNDVNKLDELPENPRSLANKPRYLQALVMVAGVLFNVIGAWVLIIFGLTIGLPAEISNLKYDNYIQNSQTTIVIVEESSPADLAGIKEGDVVLTIFDNHNKIDNPNPENISEFLNTDEKTDPTTFVINRGDETINIETSSVLNDENQKIIGIGLSKVGIMKLPPHLAVSAGTIITYEMTRDTAVGLFTIIKKTFTGHTEILKNISGPVGIAKMVGSARDHGLGALILLTAIISINLAIINLLPLPALDGGRLIMIAIESVTRKKIKAKIAGLVNGLGLLFLLILMLIITYKDILRLL